MKILKKKITEEEAISVFIKLVGKNVQQFWDAICTDLKEIYENKFIIENEQIAILDFFWAKVALENQALKNLFPIEQAERIHKSLLYYISDEQEFGKYAGEEIRKYEEAFQQDLERGEMPADAIAARLLQRWLGKNIRNFEVQWEGKDGEKIRIIDPILIAHIDGFLISHSGMWKAMKNEYKIIKGDILST